MSLMVATPIVLPRRRSGLGLILAAFATAYFGLLVAAQAFVTDPFGYFPVGNTAEGDKALFSIAAFGTYNTALGFRSLNVNFSGSFNTGVGAGTLLLNTADENTASGAGALLSNTSGSENTADGPFALFSNAGGAGNTATGAGALFSNISGDGNTATGGSALYYNIDGINNTATGVLALAQNTSGGSNTATGIDALSSNTDGNDNTAVGALALGSNTTGSDNIALGVLAGDNLTTGDNNIDIGNAGVAAESNTIRVGTTGTQTATYVAGIFGATVTEGVGVIVDTDGQLGTAVSSGRFKDDIQPMDKLSEVILSLKPVTFHYKNSRKDTPQFGLIAEDVAKVDPDLVVRDKNGEIYTVRYDAVNAMLLNEFLKEHEKVEAQHSTIGQLKSSAAKQEAMISELKKDIGVLTAQLKTQAAQIEKVRTQVEVSKAAAQIAANR
jgi:endosialidase-like protein